jgi:hypothetical protein
LGPRTVEKTVFANVFASEIGVHTLDKRGCVEQVFIGLIDRFGFYRDFVQIAVAAWHVNTLRRLLERHGLVTQDGFGVDISRIGLVGAISGGGIKIHAYNMFELRLDANLRFGVRVFGHNGHQVVFGRDGSGREVGFERIVGKMSARYSVIDFVETFELAHDKIAVDAFN